MARPNKVKMKAAWADTHNTARRDKYHRDPDYKSRVKQQGRDSYRTRSGAELRKTAAGNIGKEADFGVLRKVIIDGEETEEVTFTLREIAKLIDYHYVVVHGWLNADKFPRANVPRAGYNPDRRGAYVYTLDQAKRLLAVIAEHHRTKAYLGEDDQATILALHDAL